MNTKNPWRGLASYEEPQGTSDDYLFCGRDEETMDVVRLIDNNLFITLYGSSGIGKTSLLKAGVIPILKRRDYFPLYIRLSQEPKEISYAEAIIKRLKSSGLKEENNVEQENSDGKDRLYLWNYFATTRFFNAADGHEVYPVIILDQFEEIFRNTDKAKADLLLQQIYLLMNDELEMPDKEGYSTETNYRFVASIREDFLFVLEDSIDERSMELYKNNRYRLRSMKPENAKQVVLIPGKDCIEESQKEEVAERLTSLAKRNKNGEIDTILLSLVCAGTFDKKSAEKISLSDLAAWKDNPMDVYYHDAVNGLTDKQKQYIQKNLIREDGSRRRMDANLVKQNIGEEAFLQLTQGKNRMLTLNEQEQVELLHDQIALAVLEDRKALEEMITRQQQRKKKINRYMWLGVLAIISLMVVGLIAMLKLSNKSNKNLSRFIAEKSYSVAEKDTYLAQRLLLEVLPRYENDLLHPLTEEADSAFRMVTSMKTRRTFNGLNDAKSAFFSRDGSRIYTISKNKICIWETKTLDTIKTIELFPRKDSTSTIFDYVSLGNNDNYIAAITTTIDKRNEEYWWLDEDEDEDEDEDYDWFIGSGRSFSLSVWNTQVGDTVWSVTLDDKPIDIDFNPKKMQMATAHDSTIILWNAQTGDSIMTIKNPSIVKSTQYSPDGTKLLVLFENGSIMVRDGTTGDSIAQRNKPDSHYNRYYDDDFSGFAEYSKNGKYIIINDYYRDNITLLDANNLQPLFEKRFWRSIAATSITDLNEILLLASNGTIYVHEIQGKEVNEIELFKRRYHSIDKACFQPDGNNVLIIEDGEAMIYEFETLKPSEEYKEFDIHSANSNFKVCGDFSPNDRFLAIPFNDTAIRIYDTKTGDTIKTINAHTDVINSLSFSPDGKHIVSASNDKTIKIWDVANGVLLQTLEGHSDTIHMVKYSPDGEYLASTSSDSTLRIWEASTGHLLKTINGDDVFTRVRYSHDGKQLISKSNDGTLCFWNAKTGDSVQSIKGIDRRTVFSLSPDGKHFATASSQDSTFRIWNIETAQQEFEEKYNYSLYSVEYSHDGKSIVCPSLFDKIVVWDADTIEKQVMGEYKYYLLASFSPDDKYIVASKVDMDSYRYSYYENDDEDDDNSNGYKIPWNIEIWEAKSGKMVKRFDSSIHNWVYGVEFSPNGQYISVVSEDNKVRVFDCSSLYPAPSVPIQELIDEVRERFKKYPLTPEERKMYYLE